MTYSFFRVSAPLSMIKVTMMGIIMLITVVSTTTASASDSSSSPYVSVVLSAKWSSTPLVAEVSEFMTKRGKFWEFLDDVLENRNEIIVRSDRDAYNAMIKIAKNHISELDVAILEFSLAARYYSATVAMHFDLANEHIANLYHKGYNISHAFLVCKESMVAIGEQLLCSAKDIEDAADNEIAVKNSRNIFDQLHSLDHVYPAVASNENIPVAILYGRIEDAATKEHYNTLIGLAKQGKIRFVYRHFPGTTQGSGQAFASGDDTGDGDLYVHKQCDNLLQLSGYGVELAVKSLEYKAVDDSVVKDNVVFPEARDNTDEDISKFLFSELKNKYPQAENDLAKFRQQLSQEQSDLTPLKENELSDLAYQVSQLVMTSPKPLEFLVEITKNFPSLARSISKLSLKQTIMESFKQTAPVISRFGFQPGRSYLYINGISLDVAQTDAYSLIELLTSESKIMENLKNLGVKSKDIGSFVRLPVQQRFGGRYGVDVRSPHVVFLNDIEKDAAYKRFSSSLQEILRPAYPNQLRYIRKNMFTAVFFLHVADFYTWPILKLLDSWMARTVPIRFGLVLLTGPATLSETNTGFSNSIQNNLFELKDGSKISLTQGIANLFAYIMKQKSLTDALKFFLSLNPELESEISINSEKVIAAFSVFSEKVSEDQLDSILQQHDKRIKWNTLASNIGLDHTPAIFLNGRYSSLREVNIESLIMELYHKMLYTLQSDYYYGRINDKTDLYNYWLSKEGVYSRLSPKVFLPQGSKVKFSDLSNSAGSDLLQKLTWFSLSDQQPFKSISTIVTVPNFLDKSSFSLVYEAAAHLQKSPGVRQNIRVAFALNPNPQESVSEKTIFYAKAIIAAQATQNSQVAISFVFKLMQHALRQYVLGDKASDDPDKYYDPSLSKTPLDYNADYLETVLSPIINSDSKKFRAFFDSESTMTSLQYESLATILSLESGTLNVVTNGRIVALSAKDLFTADDILLLENLQYRAAATTIENAIRLAGLSHADSRPSDLLVQISCLLGSVSGKERVNFNEQLTSSQANIKIFSEDSTAFDIIAIVDIAAPATQKLAFLLNAISKAVPARINLILAPHKLTELPLNRYYRYVLEPRLRFSDKERFSYDPACVFFSLPTSPLFTLAMDVPNAWVVEPVISPYDLDNIHLAKVENAVSAFFELEHILIQGSCYDFDEEAPPRGLQLTISSIGLHSNTSLAEELESAKLPNFAPSPFLSGVYSQSSIQGMKDTVVMETLGYFQLKAYPGLWRVSLRQGASRRIFSLKQVAEDNSQVSMFALTAGYDASAVISAVSPLKLDDGDDVSFSVALSDFSGKFVVILVKRRPGEESNDLLQSMFMEDVQVQQDRREQNSRSESLKKPEVVEEEKESKSWFSFSFGSDEKEARKEEIKSTNNNEQGLSDNEDEEEDKEFGFSGFFNWDYTKSTIFRKIKRAIRQPDKFSIKPSFKSLIDQIVLPPKPDFSLETIHVFSVASGHLYERFMRSMMLSVVANTRHPVKFWLLKNYFSPQFKYTIHDLAEFYNFQVELVTYKWPSWLFPQTNKIRIIWAYKILFLDVLFPIDVKRVIFVDSDQTVRADLSELHFMDLQEAPYGYTPFCNDRPEMDGFKFWNQGYWKNHLQGRPYHISALYVIDMSRFRFLSAGDRLRGQYQGLAPDPNSLANLDQDLPNNMIHQLPIYSLPQEWLWCETWCSDASKEKAKTIDLCNNPLTKEPKLNAATRIVKEWTEYDTSMRVLLQIMDKKEEVMMEFIYPSDSMANAENEQLTRVRDMLKQFEGDDLADQFFEKVNSGVGTKQEGEEKREKKKKKTKEVSDEL